MYLSQTQVDGLRYFAGQNDVAPKANTIASLHRRELLMVGAEAGSPVYALTDAGRTELLERDLPPDAPVPNFDSAPKCPSDDSPLGWADDQWHCPSCGDEFDPEGMELPTVESQPRELAAEPGDLPDFFVDAAPRQTRFEPKTNAFGRRRAKNRTARKSRRINRLRSKR